MIFTCDAKELSAAIAIAGKVIPAKSPWPILANIKIVSNDSRVTLIGSDGDTTLEVDVPADVQTEGAACITFDPLAKFCASAKGERVTVSISATEARISTGRSRIGLNVARLEDYPNYTPPEGEIADLDADTFCQALRFCLAATEDSEVRYHIAGVNVSETDGDVTLWGTDGNSAHRAVLVGVPAIGGGATLPIMAAQTVLAMADKHDAMRFMISERGWHLTSGAMRAWGKVIDGQYPSMGGVVAQFGEWRPLAVSSRADLTAAIGIATIGTERDSNKAHNVALVADPGAKMVIKGFKASSGVTNAGYAEMEVEGRERFAAPVSAKYLSAALAGITGDEIALFCAGEGRTAIQVRPAQGSVSLTLEATIMTQRASLAEMGVKWAEAA